MDRYFAILGLISSFIIGALAKETVMVNSDIIVKPTPSPLIDPADRVDVILNCTGSRSDLSYYIENRMQWSVKAQGKDRFEQISLGFYVDTQRPNPSKFSVAYKNTDTPDLFFTTLTISGVNRADNGVYRCSLLEGARNLIDSKDVRLTVVNPVETVSIEIHDKKHNVLATSKKMPTQRDKALKLSPGKYMVKCDASGSNPEPRMSLFLNDRQVDVQMTAVANEDAEFASFRGYYIVNDLVINAHNSIQSLVCKANIDGEYYPSMEAGLGLMVRIDRPTIVCDNATASLGDRYKKITCMATAGENSGALMCNDFHWILSVRGERIDSIDTWKDNTKEYDILKSTCEKSMKGLEIVLDLFTVNEKLFKETFFLVFGSGENTHKHPIILYDVTVGAAGIMTPLSLLACLVMALVSKHLARL